MTKVKIRILRFHDVHMLVHRYGCVLDKRQMQPVMRAELLIGREHGAAFDALQRLVGILHGHESLILLILIELAAGDGGVRRQSGHLFANDTSICITCVLSSVIKYHVGLRFLRRYLQRRLSQGLVRCAALFPVQKSRLRSGDATIAHLFGQAIPLPDLWTCIASITP